MPDRMRCRTRGGEGSSCRRWSSYPGDTSSPPDVEGAVRDVAKVVPGARFRKLLRGEPGSRDTRIDVLEQPTQKPDGSWWVRVRSRTPSTDTTYDASLADAGVTPYVRNGKWNSWWSLVEIGRENG